MTIEQIINGFNTENTINDQTVTAIQDNSKLRKELVNYLRHSPNREFALALLDKFIAIRELPEGLMPADDLMLACYLLALHNEVGDVLKIWEAKNVDFDAFCGVDIQLAAFAGVQGTINFLKQQGTAEADKILEHITEYAECGDLDNLEKYFSPDDLPYFI